MHKNINLNVFRRTRVKAAKAYHNSCYSKKNAIYVEHDAVILFEISVGLNVRKIRDDFFRKIYGTCSVFVLSPFPIIERGSFCDVARREGPSVRQSVARLHL